MGLLEQIDYPDDLKKLDISQLPALAQELRDYIIKSVAQTGGHLAPSLGVVELTIALLYVFDPPRDKIIWDVGHQAYGYKVLTGRRDKLPTIRQYGGISGFIKRDESPYDFWGVGHASTSISAALGFAIERDFRGEDYNVVAIIGDGALTGGLAFEGLNNAGAANTEMLVILNDNAMSISPNVGALAKYLTEIVASPAYQKVKTDLWELAGKVGEIGKHLRSLGRKLEDTLKNFIVPGMLFEHLGFEYYGPVDGHNIADLIKILSELKKIRKPKLLHIITTKGKGFKPAEQDATTYHGLGRFNPETGEPIRSGGPPSYTKIFGEAMVQLGEKYPDLVAITAAMETGTGLDKFHQKFPRRFFDVGIAEEHAVVFGGALAAQGRRTVVAIYSTFLQRAYDQIIHDIALQRIPLVFAIDRGGLVGEDGPTHHGAFDISYLRTVPNVVITAPKDENELRNLLYTALERFSEPWAIRYPRGAAVGVEISDFEEVPFGKWEVLRQGDGKLLILAVGSTVHPALEAAERLAQKGVSPTVVNCRFVKPMDEELLEQLGRSHSHILTLEEGTILGGFGEGVLHFLEARGVPRERVKIHGIPDEFITHGPRQKLLQLVKLDAEGIYQVAAEIVGI